MKVLDNVPLADGKDLGDAHQEIEAVYGAGCSSAADGDTGAALQAGKAAPADCKEAGPKERAPAEPLTKAGRRRKEKDLESEQLSVEEAWDIYSDALLASEAEVVAMHDLVAACTSQREAKRARRETADGQDRLLEAVMDHAAMDVIPKAHAAMEHFHKVIWAAKRALQVLKQPGHSDDEKSLKRTLRKVESDLAAFNEALQAAGKSIHEEREDMVLTICPALPEHARTETDDEARLLEKPQKARAGLEALREE